MDRIKAGVQWVAAFIMGIWDGIPALTQLLLILMAVDLAVRVLIGIKDRSLGYKVVWDVVTKKAMTIGMVVVGALLQPYVGEAMSVNLVQAASVFYIVPELVSIVKGAGTLQVPVPNEIAKVIAYFDAFSNGKKSEE